VNIIIQERQFTLRSEYDISAPGSSYYAVKKFFSIRDNIQLMSKDRRILVRIRGRFSLFRARHDFLFSDGRHYRFWCEKFWKGVFACESNEEKFRLFVHKGLNFSIFQDDHQIAAFTKNRFVIGKGNQYDVRINGDANAPVVICMVLALNTSDNDDSTATVTYDFGNFGPEDKPFDRSWEPS